MKKAVLNMAGTAGDATTTAQHCGRVRNNNMTSSKRHKIESRYVNSGRS